MVDRREHEVGAGDAEERAQEGKSAGGGCRQRSAGPARCSGRGQSAEITGALAADQPDGHGEDREREEGACGGCDGDECREGVALAPCLDHQATGGSKVAGIGDLLGRQRPARLDHPPGRNLLPAAAAKTVERDERRRRHAGLSLGSAEELAAVDPLDVRDCTWDELWLSALLKANSVQLVGADALVDQEVRVRRRPRPGRFRGT